ncbi:MAG TPA: sodium:proton antiporter, partial [Saprospiraceae bacterium]|nr:sodium:proton antiporter [Saprospiraceae bacterium]
MVSIVILILILGYLAIVFEHPLRLDKSVPALLMGAIAWALLAIGYNNGLIDIVDSHNHLFSMTDGYSEEASEGFSNTLLH